MKWRIQYWVFGALMEKVCHSFLNCLKLTKKLLGKFTYIDESISSKLDDKNLRCIRYCNENGERTVRYPENPNGSTDAVAGICSADGRHLAMMPHPDRSFLSWQCPTTGMKAKSIETNEQSLSYSPWIKLFQNVFEWSIKQC